MLSELEAIQEANGALIDKIKDDCIKRLEESARKEGPELLRKLEAHAAAGSNAEKEG